MDDSKYFDLTDSKNDIDKLSIEKDGIFDCRIKDQLGISYDGFILAKTGDRGYMTIVECGFNTNDKGKHKPRLTFRRTDKEFKNRNVSKGSDQVIITIKTNDEGNANLRKVIGFLYKFKKLTDLGNFDTYFTLTDNNIGSFLQKLSLDENKDKITTQLHKLSVEELQNIADVTHTTKLND